MTSGKDELAEIEDKIKRTKLSKEAREKARHELAEPNPARPAAMSGLAEAGRPNH